MIDGVKSNYQLTRDVEQLKRSVNATASLGNVGDAWEKLNARVNLLEKRLDSLITALQKSRSGDGGRGGRKR